MSHDPDAPDAAAGQPSPASGPVRPDESWLRAGEPAAGPPAEDGTHNQRGSLYDRVVRAWDDGRPRPGTPTGAPASEAAPTAVPLTNSRPTSYNGDVRAAADSYADVPASLELGYGPSDLGLSPGAYDRSIPYDVVQKRRRRQSGARTRRVGRELVETVILALLIFFAVKAVIQNFRVEGASMEPSMQNNQYLLVNKAIYFRMDLEKIHQFLPFLPDDERQVFRAPRRGDVIVFKFPLDPSRDFIKRVIGVPGDTVEVKNETVYINGSPLKEDYILATPNYTYGPKTVPAGMYFVLGDNRRNSFDSHAWGSSCSAQQQCDFVPQDNIIGQAWVKYWPWDTLGLVNNKAINPQAP